MDGEVTDEHGRDEAAVVVEPRGLDEATTTRFAATVNTVGLTFAELAKRVGVALPQVTVIGTLDFAGAVQEVLDRKHGPDSQPYTTDRLGGQALGKTITVDEARTEFAIVMSAHWWTASDQSALAVGMYFMAHEMTHVLTERVRHASGALDGVTFPSQRPRDMARSITRIAVDEWRADLVADLVLGMYAKKTEGGSETPLHIADPGMLTPQGYREQLASVLEREVYPGWPDEVEEYRNWRLPLEDMLRRVLTGTDQLLTLLGHAQAEADMDLDDPALYLGGAAEHAAVRMLVGPAWEAIHNVAAGQSSLPHVDEFKRGELALLDCGQRELVTMWSRLGLTFTDLPGGGYQAHVAAPQYVDGD